MRGRRLGVVLAAVGLAVGIGTAGVASAGGEPNTDFSKLKPIKEPATCKEGDGITGDTIKTGVITVSSGPQAQTFAPGVEQGIQARVDEANSSGELGDRTIEIVNKDDQANQASNLTAAQQLVEEEDVFGIIEVSNAADGSAEYLYDEKIPVAGWHLGQKEWGIYPNMFSWRNSVPPDPENTYTSRAGDVMKQLGAKKIALVGANIGSERGVHRPDEAGDREDQGPRGRLRHDGRDARAAGLHRHRGCHQDEWRRRRVHRARRASRRTR